MPHVATGTFEVSMKAEAAAPDAPGSALGRASLEKTYDGDLAGTAVGNMLTAMTETKGSAGYVAIERVTGTLHGREGSFVLQHSGTMERGAQTLSITVVPDSGFGGLAGLTGVLEISVENGRHSYSLEYNLPE